jgi:hypothetical protein
MIMAKFRRLIDEESTDRQRRALLAALLHDARKRLKRRMAAEMLSPQDVLGALGEA